MLKVVNKERAQEILIAIVGVALTMMFEFVTLRITQPQVFSELSKIRESLEAQQTGGNTQEQEEEKKVLEAKRSTLEDQVLEKVVAVQFDLWFIGLSVLLGAHFRRPTTTSSDGTQRNDLVVPVVVLLIVLFLMLSLPGLTDMMGHKVAFSLVVPDILGLSALAYAISAIRPPK